MKKILYLYINLIMWLIAITGYYFISPFFCSLVFIALCIYSLIYFISNNYRWVSILVLYTIFFYLSLSLATMQLVGIYEIIWTYNTWICLFLYNLFFMIGSIYFNKSKYKTIDKVNRIRVKELNYRHLSTYIIMILTFSSLISFSYLCVKHGYIPLFSQSINAYVEFGSSSFLSIFYQISVILPGMCLYELKNTRTKYDSLLKICLIINLAICILVKSRDFLTGCLIILLVVYCIFFTDKNTIFNKKNIRLAILIAFSLGVFFIVTASRNYGYTYIKNLYKVDNFPLTEFLISPYVYITSGYYNFNELVTSLEVHTYGLMMLNPISILFKIDIIKTLVQAPKFYIISELNLYSSFGLPFFEFGILGMVLFGYGCGWIYDFFEKNVSLYKNVFSVVMYSICCHHIILIFFTSWLNSFQYFVYFVILSFGFLCIKK